MAFVLHATTVAAEPIRVSGKVYLTSAGGDFPDYSGPVNELIYFLGGAGLRSARGEALETIPAIGTKGNLQIARSATPQPLVAGAVHSLSTRSTFTFGQALEDGWPQDGRAYNVAGDFQFTGGVAVLTSTDSGGLEGLAPVTFAGTLSAFDLDSGALLFRHSLSGRGTGVVTFFAGNPSFFQYEYSLDPVPEPTSILLLGAGLGWVAMRVRGRREVPAAGPGVVHDAPASPAACRGFRVPTRTAAEPPSALSQSDAL